MKRVELVATMGTVISLDIRTAAAAEGVRRAVEEVSRRLQAIDAAFSPWLPDSWVSRLVRGDVDLPDCPPEVQEVVRLAVEWRDLTGGYFSPFWRRLPYGTPGPDPTGLVKGWAAHRASEVLVSHGLPDHVVNAAGDIVVSGRAVPGDSSSRWRIGISDPRGGQELVGVISLDQSSRKWAVATSGTAELGRHVTDPHTGRFPDHVASATAVVSLDLVEEGAAAADACATALVAAGEGAQALSEELEVHRIDVAWVDAEGRVHDRGLFTTGPVGF